MFAWVDLDEVETGYYYLQSRYYVPEWGRFLNADSLLIAGDPLTAVNMYAYCNNNPVMYTDHTGEAGLLTRIFNGIVNLFKAVVNALTPKPKVQQAELNDLVYREPNPFQKFITQVVDFFIQLFNLLSPVGSVFLTLIASFSSYRVNLPQARRVVSTNATHIINAAKLYASVTPQMVAAVIFAEQALNVNWVDTLTDWVYILDTSIGIGQVKMSTAGMLEVNSYITPPCVDLQERYLRLTQPAHNTKYVAAYLQYLIDEWKTAFPSIASRPDILGTLYNNGVGTPHANPAPNPFGSFVELHYPDMTALLGL